MVLQIRHQLSRAERDDERTRHRCGLHDNLSMGAALCARDGKAPALVLETTVDVAQLAGRRDLCEGQGQVGLLYRAADSQGNTSTIDFYLSYTRDAKATKRFLGKAQAYGVAITELKAEGRHPPEARHRQVKYLNHIVEADHGRLKRLINRQFGIYST